MTPDPARQLQYALKLAVDYGFAPFPVDHPLVGTRCAGVKTPEHHPDRCTERGKHPACKWSEWATNDPARLAADHYFGGPRARNIGIHCGKSRLIVVDEDELDEFARFCGDRGVGVPATFTVRTGNGFHYYFRVPAGFEHNTGEGAFHDYGINIRAGNGYVVAPGSVHASGVVYSAVGDCRDVADAPQWLLDAVKEKETKTSSDGDSDAADDAWWLDGAIPAKKRHAAMVKAAGWCLRMGMKRAEAVVVMRDIHSRLEGDKYTLADVIGRLDDIYARYEAGYRLEVTTLQSPAGDSTPEDEALRSAALADVAAEAQKLRIRRAAKRMVDAEERPAVAEPEVLSLAQRLARPRPVVTYRIDGWQPAGTRLILAAQYKAGKTTLVGNLVRSLVDGDPWLGVADVKKLAGRVVILDTEMGTGQLDQWLADQNIRNTDTVYPIPLRGKVTALDLLDPERRQEWARRLRDLHAEYVILDVLRPALDAVGLNEHTEAGRFLVPFDQLLDEAGVPDACVVHHMGHTAERSRGDSRFRDWPDVEWRLVREDADDPASPRFITAYGRDVNITESRLEYNTDTRRLSLVGGSRQQENVGEVVALVVTALEANEELSQNKLEEVLNDIPKRTVRAAVKAAVADGSVVVREGPRRSKLHSLNPLRRTEPTTEPASQSDCATAPIGAQWQSLPADDEHLDRTTGAVSEHDRALALLLADPDLEAEVIGDTA